MKTLEYNLQTLFDNNFVLKKRIIGNYNRKTVCLFRNTNKSLGGNLLKDIIDFCGTILKNNIRLPVVIYLGEIKVEDKLSYILLECIAHQLIINGFDLQIIMYPSFSIDTQGVTFSPLRFLNPYLESDSDGFVGFNGKNFISCEPDPESYSKSKVYFPGVAYNLNFVLEECNDEKN